jgi:hypothetical protein
VEYQQNLSGSHQQIGDLLSTQGDLAGASRVYSESQAVRK